LETQFTKLQGQYLAFALTYTKLNRRRPAEADFQRYFNVTPPSVHSMILTRTVDTQVVLLPASFAVSPVFRRSPLPFTQQSPVLSTMRGTRLPVETRPSVRSIHRSTTADAVTR